MVNIQDLTAVNKGKTESFLGHLTWYSVGKQLVQTKELELKLNDAGLDQVWMPKPIRSADAFRRATKEIEQRKATSNPSVFENVLIREVYSDKDMVQRNIVIETVDQNGKRLSYESKAGIITLDKEKSTMSLDADKLIIREIYQEAERKFVTYKNHYSAQQLRIMVSRILQSLAPTPVRKSGGVYFVPSVMNIELSKLVHFIMSLENSEAYKIPVIDNTSNRNMVNNKLLEHLNPVLDGCINSDDLNKGKVKVLIEEANGIIKNYRNYKSILNEESQQMEQAIFAIRSEIARIMAEM